MHTTPQSVQLYIVQEGTMALRLLPPIFPTLHRPPTDYTKDTNKDTRRKGEVQVQCRSEFVSHFVPRTFSDLLPSPVERVTYSPPVSSDEDEINGPAVDDRDGGSTSEPNIDDDIIMALCQAESVYNASDD